MNSFKQFSLSIIMLILSTITLFATNVDVTVSTPGGLEAAILAQVSNLSTVTSITISGTLNDDDFNIIKNSLSNLEFIDLGNVENTTLPNPFLYKYNRLKTIVLPYNLTNIGNSMFYGCYYLTSINIPKGVTTIGQSAFYYCKGLTSITIPNSVTSIGNGAFEDCRGLTSIVIPSSVKSIGNIAFGGCSGLTSIVVESGNPVYDSRNNCNAIIETASNTLIAGCENTKIPSSVTSIWSYAFYGCSGLTSVTIPNSVTTIGQSAFHGCSSLNSVSIPNSVTSIRQNAFSDCRELTSITLPNSLMCICTYTFSNCLKLTSVVMPINVQKIQEGAFYDCIGLTSIDIPNSVITIEKNAFDGCSGLESISVASGNTVFDSRNQCNAIIETTTNNLVMGCKNTIIPNSVTSIGNNAFSRCYGLTSIDIPNSVTSIGNKAFSSCHGLTSIDIPNSVTSIGSEVFYGCRGLTSLSIGSSVTSIGDMSFFGCENLTSLYSYSQKPPTCGYDPFYLIPIETCILYVPTGSVEAYSTANGWKDFVNIQPFEISSITEAEWTILVGIHDELVELGWQQPWDMSLGITQTNILNGLTVVNKHVTRLNLSGCLLSGSLPKSILQLPYLEDLNLSNNNFTGEINTWLDENGQLPAQSKLKTINISHNHLTGNIGLFASQFPALQSLDASYNQLTEVGPLISPTITTLNIGGQTINQTFDLDITSASQDNLFLSLPSLLRYNHEAQAFNTCVNLLCTTSDINNYNINNSNNQWGAIFTLDHDNECWSIPTVSYNYAYHGTNGETLQAMLLDSDSQKTGSIFNITLHFAMGDANFNGGVDVTDLQAMINEIMLSHGLTPFNFTAADINGDEDINVLDVIREVNLLMNTPSKNVVRRIKQTVGRTSEAVVYIDNGRLFIHSDIPVAAFDIRVRHATLQALSSDLSDLGLTCTTKEEGDGIHLIAYSLSDGKLPVGDTQVASLGGTEGIVASAVLADEEANPISTLCNAMPTNIAITNRNQIDIQPKDGRFILYTDGRGGILSWHATTLDGRVIGQGETANEHIGSTSVNLQYHGMVIITLQTTQQQIIRKTIYIK